MMAKERIALLIISILLIAASCIIKPVVDQKQDVNGLIEDQVSYKDDTRDSVKEVYITVLPAKDQSKKYAHTFTELNRDTDFKDNVEIEVKILFQEGKDGSVKPGYYGFGLTDSNGRMKLRGHSTRNSAQKSYKVNLTKKAGLWHGCEIINLSKHPFDLIRIRNKLSFDYLKFVPGLTSSKTQFVHLYIKDLSEGDFEQEFKDYGLFTHVENIDTDFLKNHGLDKKGSLYKAENFEFFRYLEKIMVKTNADYKEEFFEEVLEIKGNDDHEKLIHMLDDVNNKSKHINKTIEEHFDIDNYLTWLGVNLLLGNRDTNSQNFYLYSPTDSDKWYFIPWDFDGAWGYYEQRGNKEDNLAAWQEGISNYWGSVLHRRFFKNKNNIEALSQKIESLMEVFTEENTRMLLDTYRPIISNFLSRKPDMERHPWGLEAIDQEFERLPTLIEENRKIYYKSLEKPMPVHMANPFNFGTYHIFKWDQSYDLQGDLIEYSIDISDSPGFENIIYHQEGIRDTEYIVNKLTSGKYYWRLLIQDSKGHTQISFNRYKAEDGRDYFGVQDFYIP